jgi:hypothetical protein
MAFSWTFMPLGPASAGHVSHQHDYGSLVTAATFDVPLIATVCSEGTDTAKDDLRHLRSLSLNDSEVGCRIVIERGQFDDAQHRPSWPSAGPDAARASSATTSA